MSPRRGDPVPPPVGPGEWELVFGSNDAAKGWGDLVAHASGNMIDAWKLMRTNPSPMARTARHHRLRGNLAYGIYRGVTLPQWQIEVTAGGRVWYLVDVEARRVIVRHARTGHPKITE